VATNAELNQPDAVALAANGTVYVADVGNNRVRALLPTGRIETVAGDGRSGASLPRVGTMARNVAMSPSDVAIGPNGRVYVSSGNYVAELSASGEIVSVINLASTPGVTLRYPQCDPEALALDRTGNLYVGCANSRELIERLANGKYQLIEENYKPHDFPGIALTYGGALLIANGETLFGVISNQSTVLLGLKSFPHLVFVPSGIAVAANGTIYTDCQPGDGFDSGAGLAKISPSGAPVLLRLWKEQ
jgi:DNA-binding beta-propeller fold protein YncE